MGWPCTAWSQSSLAPATTSCIAGQLLITREDPAFHCMRCQTPFSPATMTTKTKLINWVGTTTLWVLSVLMFPSCQKSTSATTGDGPPESAILDACKKEAGKLWGGGNVSDIVRGS